MGSPLTKRQQELLGIFRRALSSERQAQEMYSSAAYLCDDPELKALLESFAEQEAGHEQKLMELYSNLRTQGEFKDADAA